MIELILAMCPNGPRIEFGVFRGATLEKIANHDGVTIGVDTFEGMGAPGRRDTIDGRSPYPKGRLAAPIEGAASLVPRARLIKGHVPEVLSEICCDGFGFAHIDMDHYLPTIRALEWVWPRMAPNGIVCCDDWFVGRTQLASGAIAEFAASHELEIMADGRRAFWRREG